MKKYLLLILISIAIITLVGCSDNSKKSDDNIKTSSDLSKNNIDNITNDENEKNIQNGDKPKLLTIDDIPKEQFEHLNINYSIGNMHSFFNFQNCTKSGNTVYLDNQYNYTRQSTGLLYMYNNNFIENNLKSSIDICQYGQIAEFDTPYEISNIQTNVTFKGYIENSPITIIDNYIFGYDISDITVKAFIKRNDDKNTYDIIIDPLSLKGIPVYHTADKFTTFDINKFKIESDTLQLTGSIDVDNISQEDKDSFNFINSEYVYASISINKMSVNYITDSNGPRYENKALIKSCTPIDVDIEDICKGNVVPELIASKTDKNMQNIYDIMINNIDSIYDDKVVGISLLDLDFDTKPELLVTRKKELASDSSLPSYHDVDIYKFDVDKLKFIDTLNIFSYSSLNDGVSEILGLKTLDDGTNRWYTISYIDKMSGLIKPVHYLFSLENDSLQFTEVFRIEAPDKNQENSTEEIDTDEKYEDNNYNYYYYGDLINFDVIEEPDKETGENKKYYSWNGFKDEYRKCEVFNQFRDDFCNNMKGYYMLDNEFFTGNMENDEKKLLDKRTLLNKFVTLIDNYYLNGSSSELTEMYFGFGNSF